MTNRNVSARLSEADSLLIRKVCEDRRERISDFFRRSILTELASLNYLTPQEHKSLGFQRGSRKKRLDTDGFEIEQPREFTLVRDFGSRASLKLGPDRIGPFDGLVLDSLGLPGEISPRSLHLVKIKNHAAILLTLEDPEAFLPIRSKDQVKLAEAT